MDACVLVLAILTTIALILRAKLVHFWDVRTFWLVLTSSGLFEGLMIVRLG